MSTTLKMLSYFATKFEKVICKLVEAFYKGGIGCRDKLVSIRCDCCQQSLNIGDNSGIENINIGNNAIYICFKLSYTSVHDS